MNEYKGMSMNNNCAMYKQHKKNPKVKNILEDSLDSIPSPSPSVKIQIIGGKVYLR